MSSSPSSNKTARIGVEGLYHTKNSRYNSVEKMDEEDSALHSVSRIALTIGIVSIFAGAAFAQGNDSVPLPLKLPKPAFAGTPRNSPPGTNVEKPTGKPRPIPMVPKGTINLALHKKVT